MILWLAVWGGGGGGGGHVRGGTCHPMTESDLQRKDRDLRLRDTP